MGKETNKEMGEALEWAQKKLERIKKYETKGIMPEACKNRLPLEIMILAYKRILATPTDPQRPLWERAVDLAHDQLLQ